MQFKNLFLKNILYKKTMMMAYEWSESARDNFGKFIYQFKPKTKVRVRKLERILIKLYRLHMCLLFTQTCLNEGLLPTANTHTYTHTRTHIHTHTHTHTHIYIYLYIYIYTFSNYVRIRDVVQKTCRRRWPIGKSGERGSGISVLPARQDDDDDIHITR